MNKSCGSAVDLEALVFEQPWTARLFGLTLALSEKGLFDLSQFQAKLIEAVGSYEEDRQIVGDDAYYTRWLEALSSLLGVEGLTTADSLGEAERRVTERLRSIRHHHGARGQAHPRPTPLVVA